MRIQSSHLALRFYKHDGWSESVLRECLEYGELEFCEGDFLNYWRLKINSGFDIEKLMKYVTKVDRWYDGECHKTDEEYLREMNW